MSGADVGAFGLRNRFWVLAGRWVVPGMMMIAYFLLVMTADTDLGGNLWISVGMAFVLALWIVFRVLMQRAGIARAIAVGDADRLLALAQDQLARRRDEEARAPFHVYRALAFQSRGDWPGVLGALEAVRPGALRGARHRGLRLLAASARIAALVETGRVAEAREVLDRDLVPEAPARDERIQASAYLLATLAHGRVLAAEGTVAQAEPVLQRVIDDLRSGERARAVAHHAAARCAEQRGDAAAAARHRERAAALAPRSWLAAPVTATVKSA